MFNQVRDDLHKKTIKTMTSCIFQFTSFPSCPIVTNERVINHNNQWALSSLKGKSDKFMSLMRFQWNPYLEESLLPRQIVTVPWNWNWKWPCRAKLGLTGPNGAKHGKRGRTGPKGAKRGWFTCRHIFIFSNPVTQTKIGQAMGILLIPTFSSDFTKSGVLFSVLVIGIFF